MGSSPSRAGASRSPSLPNSGVAAPVRVVACRSYTASREVDSRRSVPEEVAVAFTYDGTTHAVMMATPADLEDLAIGFSVTEGIVAGVSAIESLEVLPEAVGIELRMRLAGSVGAAFQARRRMLAGPLGCGLCGIESLEEAMRVVPTVQGGIAIPAEAINRAVGAIGPAQALNRETRAVHAAAFCGRDGAPVMVREDVGRHNALDKLAGGLLRAGVSAADGMILVTSRVSVELVQKAAMIGAPMLVAVSAPTALAIRTAEAAGITLVAVARGDGFEVFAHGGRVGTAREAYGVV